MSKRLIYAEDAIEALSESLKGVFVAYEDIAKKTIDKVPSAQPQHEVRFSDEDHVWIDGKQYISLKRFGEAVKDARKEAHKHGRSKEITKGLAMAQRWIPVSERMPENGHYYLWCSNGGNVQSDYYWDGFENGQKYGYTIVAWMPLPEPWKGEQE